MDWTAIILAAASMVITFGITWGATRQSQKDLERRHSTLAEETRHEFRDMKSARAASDEKTATMNAAVNLTLGAITTAVAVLQEKEKTTSEHIVNLERNKASVDAVASMKEFLDRIDGKLDTLMNSLIKK